jgi:hypothetical protein
LDACMCNETTTWTIYCCRNAFVYLVRICTNTDDVCDRYISEAKQREA